MNRMAMTDDQWQELMAGLTQTRYQLLLGAGASLDATDRSGSPLPGGARLANEMAVAFSIPGDVRGNLRQVFALAKSRKSIEGHTVLEYLASRFRNAVPPACTAT